MDDSTGFVIRRDKTPPAFESPNGLHNKGGSKMWLMVDDMREIRHGCDVLARTFDAAKELLDCVIWDGLVLNHDLADEKGRTGHDLLKWMFHHSTTFGEYDWMPKEIILVTQNPVGRQNMINVLKDNGYHTDDDGWFRFYRVD